MNDAGNRNSHGDRLVHFIVLLAELLVAEKLRVHAFQGLLRVLLRLFDACFSRRGAEKRRSERFEQRKGLKNAIENAMEDIHRTTQRPMLNRIHAQQNTYHPRRVRLSS